MPQWRGMKTRGFPVAFAGRRALSNRKGRTF